jgi:DNA (cytosine-5)-methyltransferase 1
MIENIQIIAVPSPGNIANAVLPEVPLVSPHAFPYKWTLADANFTKDKGKVFSCFACGGGSTMGYKLAGFDVLGCNEIDPKMIEAYKANHNPKYAYLEPIQTFKLRNDLPDELYQLDILDGSPPCSSFSMAGNREKDWGKDKVFREGQAEQVLDTLFFDFIELAEKLQPKVVIAENVKGLLMGEAREYVRNIYKAFDKAGYYCQHWLLDASKMGVPQRRERVFFVALRKDLAEPFLYQQDMFTVNPKLELEFKEPAFLYSEIEDVNDNSETLTETQKKHWLNTPPGNSFSAFHDKGHWFNSYRISPNEICPTVLAGTGNAGIYHYQYPRKLNTLEYSRCSTFPTDYNYLENKPKYLMGMSVPPLMTAQIAKKIYEQWLSKL